MPGAGKIPFICFDLAGGANIAGSNVLVGQQGGQLDFLSTAGYSKLGLPGNMTPNTSIGAGSFVDQQLGLAFHSDSAFLRGMLERTAVTTRANVNGAVIPALSRERHRQQSAQPDVRHLHGGRARRPADADRFARARIRAATRWRRPT